jgi:hypothetical protein
VNREPIVSTAQHPEPEQRLVVEARPIVMSRIGWSLAAFTLVVFAVNAAIAHRDNAGADIFFKDQIGILVVGVIVAGLFVMLTRPRLRADPEAVRLRSFLGGWRTVPWDLIVRVDFPRNVRFARLVLPADETFAIYAIQRLDRDRAVESMAALRALWARTHAQDAGGDRPA